LDVGDCVAALVADGSVEGEVLEGTLGELLHPAMKMARKINWRINLLIALYQHPVHIKNLSVHTEEIHK
jgi:hypothetical protein